MPGPTALLYINTVLLYRFEIQIFPNGRTHPFPAGCLAGLRPGMRCVDLGCGGEGTFELAEMTGPGGFVTGVDMDEVKLALARRTAAERGLANVEFRQANVSDWAEPAAYDFVYSRLLLMHLKQPEDLLRRMWEAVGAGGVLAVEDADFDGLFCHPENAGFDFFSHMLLRVVELNAGDARLGRKLYRHFLRVGIPDPQTLLSGPRVFQVWARRP
jgi:2-polyprenyl-3-methyl-5-hydroxy-6-metoxy-1,4-benzoquinol methylase